MTSRERVSLALEHKEPDRVPTFYRGISPPADWIFEIIDIAPYIYFKPQKNFKPREQNGIIFEELGIGRKKVGPHLEMVYHPLADFDDPKILDDYPWPDPFDKARVVGMREEVIEWQERGKMTAVMTSWGGSTGIFECSWYMTGLEKFLTDIYVNPAFAEALLDKMLELHKGLIENILSEIGDIIDIVCTGDDLATQKNLLVSPTWYRSVLKPRQKELIEHIKKFTKAKVYYHSCGNILPLVGDLIDIGIDILDPIQPKALDTVQLKKCYGDKLIFFGGIDEQEILPFGSPEEVRKEVRKRFMELGKNGGLILGPAHWIQPDTPKENIIAMYEEILNCIY
ncbi:MAG: uroporphyrinogen decarboxylase family protein [bacterium]